MQSNYTNNFGTNLIMATYLANDSYDYKANTISATGLMKPVRQVVLAGRVPPEYSSIDISRVVKSRIGTSVHDGVEQVWTTGSYKKAMKSLNYDSQFIENIKVNPGYKLENNDWVLTGEDLPVGCVPVYIEIRTSKEVMGKTITGKFDSVIASRVGDIKTTSVYTYINQNKIDDYSIQGSIYRWLNPTIITDDFVDIHYVFTDWSEAKAKFSKDGYPKTQILTQSIELMSLQATQAYIESKITVLERHKDSLEFDLPHCTPKELWQRDPVYKYYKNPQKLSRSTKNYDNLGAASLHLHKDGSVGVVVPVPGQVVACRFCDAFEMCKQKDIYLEDGTLVV